MWQFVRERPVLLAVLTLVTLLTITVSVIGLPRTLAKLPADYFVVDATTARIRRRQHLPSTVRRQLLGLGLVVVGVVLLFLPGQGVLTIVAGLMVMDFPGKRRWLRWLATRDNVRPALQWARQRAGEPPFEMPPRGSEAE